MHSSSSSLVGSSGLARPCGLSDPELETCSESSESFADELLRGFRLYLMNLPALGPLSAKMEAAAKLPQRAILAALRTMTCTISLTILVDEPPEAAADDLVRSLVKEYGIDLLEQQLTPEDLTKCAKWLICIASYFADQEFA
jgi:hypothetical protein